MSEKELSVISEEKLSEYLDLFQSTSGITPKEKLQFINIAKMSNLNPFKREIYITAYGSGEYRQCSIIVGYEVYIKRAELSGLLDGWSIDILPCSSVNVSTKGDVSRKEDIKAVITINRKDFSKPFIHEVVFSEYVQKTKNGDVNKFWREKPQTMLKKVAISQGFRMCFNEVLGGLPYTKEEILDEKDYEIVNDSLNNTEKKQSLGEILDEAKASLIDVDSIDSLNDLWDYYPELHENKEWIKIVNELKKELELKTKNQNA